MNSNNPRFSVVPIQGRQMPKDWERNAKARGASADAAYQARLENAWKGSASGDDANLMRRARLTSDGPSWPDILGQK